MLNVFVAGLSLNAIEIHCNVVNIITPEFQIFIGYYHQKVGLDAADDSGVQGRVAYNFAGAGEHVHIPKPVAKVATLAKAYQDLQWQTNH